METQVITEGEIELEVHKLEKYRTSPREYVPALTPVFFNPLMELSRDISVASVQVMSNKTGKLRICDPMAGVGARALRYAKEVGKVAQVVANDRSLEAVKMIRRNVNRNKLQLVEVWCEDANVFCYENRSSFHVVDLDPFGSPTPFVESACSALLRQSMIFVTATDTAPLCGTYSKVCLRKYGARSLRTPYCHEIGLRILIGFCQRVGARHDIALRPLLSYSIQHYFRAYFQARTGARRANKVLKEQGYISHCFGCGRRVITTGLPAELPHKCECGRKFAHAGPMWLGPLADVNFVKQVIGELSGREFKLKGKAIKLLKLCVGEAEGSPAFYDSHETCSRAGVSPPKLRSVLKRLREKGYSASRTHFSDTGLRTDAPLEVLMEVLEK